MKSSEIYMEDNYSAEAQCSWQTLALALWETQKQEKDKNGAFN